MTEIKKTDDCSCVYRKHIDISITAINLTEDFTDLDLMPVLDFSLKGPKGQPVLKIRFCPWCGKHAGKVEKITHYEAPESDEERSGEEWKNPSQEND